MPITLDKRFDETPFEIFSVTLGFQRLIRSLSRKSGVDVNLSPGMPAIYFALLNSGGCIMRDLGVALDMPKATLSGLVTGMEEIGWIERRPLKEDGRAYFIRLTPSARKMEPAMSAFHNSLRELLENGLRASDLKALNRILSTVRSNIHKHLDYSERAS